MDRSLHEAIHEAADVVERTGHTHTEVAEEVLGMKRNLHRKWRKEELREEGEYQGYEKDEERLRSLTEWLESVEDSSEGEPYSGPADAEDDPLSVLEEELGSVDRGDDPSEADLTGRERYIATRLQQGETLEGLVDDLDTRPSVIGQHLKDLKAQGWKVYVDHTAGMVAIEGDNVLRSSEHKGTRTRKANRWWEARHNELVRRFRSLDVPDADLTASGDTEDWVTHMTDLHNGDKVRRDDGTVVYETDDIPGIIDYITDQSLSLARHHSAEYDDAHVLWGGDFVTGEAIYEGQFEDLDAWLDRQIEVLVDPLVRQIKSFSQSGLFNTVQVIAVVGNHGQNRASGTSRQANADLILYKFLRIVVAQLLEHAGILSNVRFRIGQAETYRNFEMRNGRIAGHLRHGQHRRPQAETSARKKDWQATLLDHDFDIAYMGHYHISGRIPWSGPPILSTGSPKPAGEFVERIGERGPKSTFRDIATCHGVSDDGLTAVFPIDTRNY